MKWLVGWVDWVHRSRHKNTLKKKLEKHVGPLTNVYGSLLVGKRPRCSFSLYPLYTWSCNWLFHLSPFLLHSFITLWILNKSLDGLACAGGSPRGRCAPGSQQRTWAVYEPARSHQRTHIPPLWVGGADRWACVSLEMHRLTVLNGGRAAVVCGEGGAQEEHEYSPNTALFTSSLSESKSYFSWMELLVAGTGFRDLHFKDCTSVFSASSFHLPHYFTALHTHTFRAGTGYGVNECDYARRSPVSGNKRRREQPLVIIGKRLTFGADENGLCHAWCRGWMNTPALHK